MVVAFSSFGFADTLAGVREDDKAKQGHNIVPRAARPQFPMPAWASAIATGTKSKPHPTSDEEFQAAKKLARGDAEFRRLPEPVGEHAKALQSESHGKKKRKKKTWWTRTTKSKKPMKRFPEHSYFEALLRTHPAAAQVLLPL